MDEVKIIEENELADLLEEAKGDSAEPVAEIEKEGVKEGVKDSEIEIELEEENKVKAEVEPVKEDEGIELEIEKEAEVEHKEVVEPEIEIDIEETAEVPVECSHSIDIVSKKESVQTGFLVPVCSVDEMVHTYRMFEEAKTKLLTDKDVLYYNSYGRPTTKENAISSHIVRSGWRKLGRFFGLCWDILSVERQSMANGGYLYKVKTIVWHKRSGESVTAEGAASSKDPFFTKSGNKEANEEDVLMKAQTVSVNRGIADLLGSAEISVEEIE